jgi:DNA-binding MarR family transcriptional regulator
MIVNHDDYPEKGSTGGGPPRVPAALAPYLGYLLFAAFARARWTALRELGADMHPRLLVVLSAIDEQPMSQGELGARLDLGRNTMVTVVDALEAKGLVERGRDPADRRAYRLLVTERGREALTEFRPIMKRAEDGLTRRLSAAQRTRLIELLQALLAALGDTRLPASLVARPGFLIARSHLRMRAQFEEALEPLGIQARHFGALEICAHAPGSQQSLAAELGVSGTIVVDLVDALEQRGLAERRRNALDRRSYVIALTSAGDAALERARAALAELEERIAEGIGADTLAELRALLRVLLGVD